MQREREWDMDDQQRESSTPYVAMPAETPESAVRDSGLESRRPPPSPEFLSGWVSRTLFLWTNGLLKQGAQVPLKDDDVWDLSELDRTNNVFSRFQTSYNMHDSEGVVVALKDTLKRSFIISTILRFIADGLQFVGPLLLKPIVEFVQSTNEPMWKGYMYVGIVFASFIVRTIASQLSFHYANRMAMHTFSSMVQLIYHKSLRLSNSGRRTQSTGKITNLMSVDSFRLMMLMTYVHFLWTSPTIVVVAMVLIIIQVGWIGCIGPAVFLLVVPLQKKLMSVLGNLRKQASTVADERIRVLNEFVTGIRIVKFYAWEFFVSRRVASIRSRELQLLRRQAYIRSSNELLLFITPIVISIAVFGAYAALGNDLNPAQIFSVLALFNMLQLPLRAFPMTLFSVIDAKASLQRMNDFIKAEELQADSVSKTCHDIPCGTIRVTEADFAWDIESAPTLCNISFDVQPGQLVAVVGSVGSGKSSMTSALIGEMFRLRGEVSICGRVAYAPQQAWIKNATVRENILFGNSYDEHRYKDVLERCQLTADLAILPAGDQTEIGERGINLSGGQKQRVSIARAVYANRDVCVLDDCLSALDAHVAKRIFEDVILGCWKNKTRLLVTHGLQFLPQADRILVMRAGCIVEAGTYTQLMSDQHGFADLIREYAQTKEGDESTSELDDSDTEEVDRPQLKSHILPEHQAEQHPSNGFSNGGLLIHTESTAKGAASSFESSQAVAVLKRTRSSPRDLRQRRIKSSRQESKPSGLLMQEEERDTGEVPSKVYSNYIKSAKAPILSTVVLLLYVFVQAVRQGSDWWLSVWTSAQITPDPGLRFYLIVYTAFAVTTGLLVLFRGMLFASLSLRIATNLQVKTVMSVLRAPLSFFDTTPVGRILNRFGRDQDSVDQSLPLNLGSVVQSLLQIISTIVFISVITPLFLVVAVPLGIVYQFVVKYFLKSSREIKRFESVSRSPVYAHFSETLAGLATVRAFGLQSKFIAELSQRVDTNLRAFFAGVVVNRWLSIRIEFMSAVAIAATALFGVLSKSTSDQQSSLVGLSLSWILQITVLLSFAVRMTAETELLMNSVQRIMYYANNLPKEAPFTVPDRTVPPSWPQHGVIEVRGLELRYRPELPPVLNGVSFRVDSQEKVGIVGRTGSGKSSLILALMRIVEPSNGVILIDDINIQSIGLHDLRSSIAIIPQDPVLFEGTIRSNLDPFEEHSDEALMRVLELVQMRTPILHSATEKQKAKDSASLPPQDSTKHRTARGLLNTLGLSKASEDYPPAQVAQGAMAGSRERTYEPHDDMVYVELDRDEPEVNSVLNTEIFEGGENFSVGQRQLLCMARALLRDPRILLMDEATASVDVETDAFIQRMVKSQFESCTILTVAHRLHTVIQSDKVLVLDQGRIVEYDDPVSLLKKENGVFADMVQQSGSAYAEKMLQLAQDNLSAANGARSDRWFSLN